MAGKGKMTAREAILKVLADASKPMRVPDIIKEAVPMTSLKGKSPGQTIYSVLYGMNKKSDSPVELVSKGTFKLSAAGRKAMKDAASSNGSSSKPAAASKPKATAKKAEAKPDPKKPAAADESSSKEKEAVTA